VHINIDIDGIFRGKGYILASLLGLLALIIAIWPNIIVELEKLIYIIVLLPTLTVPVVILKKFKLKNILIKSSNDITTFKDALIVKKGGHIVGFKFLVVDELPYTHMDLTAKDLLHYSRNFTNILASTPGTLGFILLKDSVSSTEYTRNIDGKITELRIMLSSDPANPSLERKLAKLENIRKRLLRGEKPLKVSLIAMIISEGITVEEVYKELQSRTSVLKLSLASSLGLKCKVAHPLEIMEMLKLNLKRYEQIVLENDLSFLTPLAPYRRPSYILNTEGIFLGEDLDSKAPVFYDFKNHSLKHIVVVGPTGRGKTTLLKSISMRVLDTYPEATVWILDFKGEFSDIIKLQNVTYFDASKTPINILDSHFTTSKIRARQVVEAFKSVVSLEPIEEYILYSSILELYEYKDKPTLLDLIEHIRRLKGEELREQAHIYSLLSKLETFSDRVFVEGKIDNKFRDIGTSIVYDLSKLPDEYRNFYTINLLQIIHNYMLSLPPTSSLRCFLVLDEAWRILRSSEGRDLIIKLIKEGRAFGISLVLSSQDINDFPREILDNAGTLVVFGSNSREYIDSISRYMSLTEDEKNRMMWLKVGEALIRIYGDPRPIWVKVVPETCTDDEELTFDLKGMRRWRLSDAEI